MLRVLTTFLSVGRWIYDSQIKNTFRFIYPPWTGDRIKQNMSTIERTKQTPTCDYGHILAR